MTSASEQVKSPGTGLSSRESFHALGRRLSRICQVALLAVVAACGGGSGDGSGGSATGSLAVSVTGLPLGLKGCCR
jgi:hypothetical protein